MTTPTQNQRLMIARLTFNSWYPRKFDRKASEEIAANHTAHHASQVGRYNKILISLASIKPLQQAIDALYKKHTRMTAPWTDKGERVLPVDLYFEHVQIVREGMAAIGKLADEFAYNEYAKQREEAKIRLGSLFKESDYPEEIRSRFNVTYSYQPLPNPEDVRVWGIGMEAAKQIEADVTAALERSRTEAHAHIVDQVHTRAVEFVEKVRKFDDGKFFRDSALENLRDITGLVLRGLNVNGDQQLYKAAEELNDMITDCTADELRQVEGYRISKPNDVEKTLERFAGVFGGISK